MKHHRNLVFVKFGDDGRPQNRKVLPLAQAQNLCEGGGDSNGPSDSKYYARW